MGAALATLVFTVGATSAPLRACPHHSGVADERVPTPMHALAGTDEQHDGHADPTHATHAGEDHRSGNEHAEPCTCLSHCETSSAEPTAPPIVGLLKHDPPAPEIRLPDPDLILARAPHPRVLPFPNPPPPLT